MILVKNGTVHFPKGEERNVDILIDGEKIVEIGDNLTAGAQCIDASVNPDIHVRYSLDPTEVRIQGYERHGITAFGAVPNDSALIAGQTGVYHTSGRTTSEMAVSEDAALKVNFIPSVKRTFASRDMMPMTRMGMVSMLRNELCLIRNCRYYVM